MLLQFLESMVDQLHLLVQFAGQDGAMGATTTKVIGSMMRQALILIAAGLGTGFSVAWLLSSSMSGVIFGVEPRDSVTFAVSSALLLIVAASSSFAPLTRVAKLDPVALLRAE